MQTLIHKDTRMFMKYHNGEFWEVEIPHLFNSELTLETIRNYADSFDNVKLDTSNVILVSVTLTINS